MNPAALRTRNKYGTTPIDWVFHNETDIERFQWKLSIGQIEGALVKRKQKSEEEMWTEEEEANKHQEQRLREWM